MLWQHQPVNIDEVNRLSSQLQVSKVCASLLWQLGIRDRQQGHDFLYPKLRNLCDPFELKHMDRAVARLLQAMRQRETVAVFGDYDVDGITSTCVMVHFLRRFNIYPQFFVPQRLNEGYGLSQAALERMRESVHPDLLITVDCGTNSHAEIALLRSWGIDVLILDHHQCQQAPPEDAIVVNPHLFDGEACVWRHLSAVGIVFKFIHALLKALREQEDETALSMDLKEYLDLIALGTIADLVPLQGENRILAKNGLRRLMNPRRAGLAALYEVGGIKLGNPVTPFDVSFRLGPRINACGRLADAKEPIEMLLSKDWQLCRETARNLDEFNRERQAIEKDIVEAAVAQVEENYADDPGLVLFDPNWHPGVVGIVASRISQKYYRPTLILGAEGELAKGSGRSVANINLVEALTPCDSLIASWGGHPLAVGISLDPAHLPLLREQFCQEVLNQVAGELPDREIRIAHWVEPDELTETLLEELEMLSPFGQGNPEPIFGLKGVCLSQIKPFGNEHFRFQLITQPGRYLSGVAWKMGQNLPPEGQPIDIGVRFAWNIWNDRRQPQLTLVVWR